MLSIFPRHEDFFDLFQKQGALVRQGCDALLDMLERFENLEDKAAKLKETEHQADVVTHEIFEKLNRTFITPIEREDIHDLGGGLDDVVDAVEAIGSRLVLFRLERPTPEAVKLARVICQAGAQIEQATTHLKGLRNLAEFTVEITRLENEADQISRQAVADLFNGGHDLIDVVRWKEIYGRLEAAVDRCEDVANTVEAIVLKNR